MRQCEHLSSFKVAQAISYIVSCGCRIVKLSSWIHAVYCRSQGCHWRCPLLTRMVRNNESSEVTESSICQQNYSVRYWVLIVAQARTQHSNVLHRVDYRKYCKHLYLFAAVLSFSYSRLQYCTCTEDYNCTVQYYDTSSLLL